MSPVWPARLEGDPGFIGVLHTWNQTVLDHFHLHCLVPGGVLSGDRTVWTGYAKSPFSGHQKVLEYLGRYTHRVAISNFRIKAFENRSHDAQIDRY